MKADEFKHRFLGFSEKIYRYAFAITGNREDAEDVMQEVFEKLWVRRNSLTSVENDEAFVIAVAKNSALDRLRRKSRQRTVSIASSLELGDGGQQMHQLEAKEKLQLLNTLLSTLSVHQEMAIRLRHFAGYSLSEIAETLEVTEVNVRQLLSRGRRALKQKMKEYE